MSPTVASRRRWSWSSPSSSPASSSPSPRWWSAGRPAGWTPSRPTPPSTWVRPWTGWPSTSPSR
ncbi:MAG: hypothetical protein E6G27_08230 [Actinobacteria bacterium]|nr:MAG: hypothetical protein E6G27_08230 [Actinomycetota bacterium]